MTHGSHQLAFQSRPCSTFLSGIYFVRYFLSSQSFRSHTDHNTQTIPVKVLGQHYVQYAHSFSSNFLLRCMSGCWSHKLEYGVQNFLFSMTPITLPHISDGSLMWTRQTLVPPPLITPDATGWGELSNNNMFSQPFIGRVPYHSANMSRNHSWYTPFMAIAYVTFL